MTGTYCPPPARRRVPWVRLGSALAGAALALLLFTLIYLALVGISDWMEVRQWPR